MGKLIKFSDTKFFGIDFIKKYEEFKERRLNEIGPIDMRTIGLVLLKIHRAEEPQRENLTQLAIATAKNLFPVIDIAGIQFDVEIIENISHKSISEDGTPDYPEPIPEMDEETYLNAAKQKILNAFAQGAAVSMNTIHHMVPELDAVDSQLKSNYDKLLKANEVAYLTAPEEQFAEMAIQSDDDENIGGTNKVEFRNHIPYVVAKATNFVILVHEMIKGVYTYLALNAYDNELDYHKTSLFTESIASEIEDIGCGKLILNLLRDYLLDNFDKYYVHECFFEMYIVAMAKLPADEIIGLMHGLIKGSPNKAVFETLARNCFYDLKDFDKKRSGY